MHFLLRRATGLDAHHRFGIALAVAVAGFAAAYRFTGPPARALVGWDIFAFVSTVLAWTRILGSNARASVQAAKLQDSSRTTIFVLVLVAALASLFAVGVLLASAKTETGHATGHILLAVGTVICSWSLTHTIFTLRYAHLFYRDTRGAEADAVGSGLDFPGEEKHPDFLDFAYFSFVIGMTCQVSDVQITSREIRGVALLHGLISFIFNTVILAFSLNLASGLL
jgi:uncharacterized membrane protein